MKKHKSTANLYILQGTRVTGEVVVASKSMTEGDVTKLWHMHLRKMSEKDMTS